MASNNFSLNDQFPTTFTNPSGVLIGDYISLSGANNDIPSPTYVGNIRASAVLEIQSTEGAVLFPRMTSIQRNALLAPVNGMIIYNTTINSFQFYQNGSWSSGTNGIVGTPNEIDVTTGAGATTISIHDNAILPGTGGVTLPSGTSAERAGGAGTIRYNTQGMVFETTNDGVTWSTIQSTGTGVNSVGGTLDRITVSPTTGLVIVDIAATYVGQSSITTVGTLTSGALGSGFTTVAPTVGGTGIATYALGDTLYASAANVLSSLSGNITAGTQYLSQTGTGTVSAAPVWATIAGSDITGAALTKVDDTNVTLTLGGTPATALLRASSITVGWSGQLGLTRGGTNASLTADNGGIVYSTASALAILASTATARQMFQSGASGAPAWSTTTWPATTTINRLLYSNAANTVTELATINGAALTANSTGVPSWRALSNGQLIIGNTGGSPLAGTLTPTGGLVVTNGAASITIGLPASVPGRNLIFNGGMNVWQRGTSFTPTTYQYGPDRWQVGNNNASSGFIQVFDANTNSYLLRLQRNVGTSSTNSVLAATSLTSNMCVKARNNILTLSFVASTGSNFSGASSQMTVVLATGTGPDVSCITTGFTGQVNAVNTTQTVNGTPTKYSFTTSAIPSNVTQLGVVLGWTPVGTAGVSDYLQISEVQLEIAPAATNFEVVSYQQEFQRCQYFYQVLSSIAGYASGTTAIVCTPSLQNALRNAPTVSETGFLVFTDGIANYTQTSNTITNYMDSGFGGLLIISGFVGLTDLRPAAANFGVNTNRLTFDSELY